MLLLGAVRSCSTSLHWVSPPRVGSGHSLEGLWGFPQPKAWLVVLTMGGETSPNPVWLSWANGALLLTGQLGWDVHLVCPRAEEVQNAELGENFPFPGWGGLSAKGRVTLPGVTPHLAVFGHLLSCSGYWECAGIRMEVFKFMDTWLMIAVLEYFYGIRMCFSV